MIVGSAPGGELLCVDLLPEIDAPSTAAAFFVTYDYLKHNLPSPIAHPSAFNHVLAASAGECVACLIRVPTEIVKSRMQTSAYGLGASSLDAFRQVIRSGGLPGLYRGFNITIMREVSP